MIDCLASPHIGNLKALECNCGTDETDCRQDITFGDIYKEFLNKCNCPEQIMDYRPCVEMFDVPFIPNAILIWFKDGSKEIYISKEAENDH